MEFNFKATDVQKHTASHILAAAVSRKFPNIRIGVGPVTKSGFYYDFDLDTDLSGEDIIEIEKNIKDIIDSALPLTQYSIQYEKGKDMLLQQGQLFKVEIIKSISEDSLSFYKLGEEFTDLCRGPHLNNTSEVSNIKITDITKEHWNGDGTKPLLTRIHGSIFINEKEYNDYISFSSETNQIASKVAIDNNLLYKSRQGPFVITNRGTVFLRQIQRFIDDLFLDYEIFQTESNASMLTTASLSSLFKSNPISYKNLPFVYKETSTRSDLSQNFRISDQKYTLITTQSDSLVDVGNLFEIVASKIDKFCLNTANVEIRCSNLDDLFVSSLSNLLQKRIVSHTKILSFNNSNRIEINISVKDRQSKKWDLVNIELIAKSEEISYRNNEGANYQAVVMSFRISKENFFAYLLEQYGVSLPFNFHPVQVYIIPKSKEYVDFSSDVYEALKGIGFTTFIDLSSKSLKFKIRRAEKLTSKFILIVGAKEEANNSVSVRQNSKEVGLVSLDKLSQFIIDNRLSGG